MCELNSIKPKYSFMQSNRALPRNFFSISLKFKIHYFMKEPQILNLVLFLMQSLHNNVISEQMAKLPLFCELLCIRNVSGSNLSPDGRLSRLRFSRFSSVFPGNCWDCTLKIGQDHLLPNPFQFIIIHLSPYHWRYIVSSLKKLEASLNRTEAFICVICRAVSVIVWVITIT
jgi:hypothetical protein